jgi:hypothetical protein
MQETVVFPIADRDGLFAAILATDDELTPWYHQQIERYGTQDFLRREDYNFDLLKRLNEYGVPSVTHDDTWQRIIAMVIGDRRDDVLQFLLTLKIAMKVENTDILSAVLDGNLYLTNLLLEKGADPNTLYPDGDTPLIKACRAGHLEVVRCLLKWKARDDGFNEAGDNALLLACRMRDILLVRLLTLDTTTINAHSATGPTALVYACHSNDPELVDVLLLAGADIFTQCHCKGFVKPVSALKCTTNSNITTMLKASIGIHEITPGKRKRQPRSRHPGGLK